MKWRFVVSTESEFKCHATRERTYATYSTVQYRQDKAVQYLCRAEPRARRTRPRTLRTRRSLPTTKHYVVACAANEGLAYTTNAGHLASWGWWPVQRVEASGHIPRHPTRAAYPKSRSVRRSRKNTTLPEH